MGILDELSMLFRGRTREQKKAEPRPGAVPWQSAFVPLADTPLSTSGSINGDRTTVHYTAWTIFPEGFEFRRKWMVEGVGENLDTIIVHMHVKMEEGISPLLPPHRFVSIIIEPGYGDREGHLVGNLAVNAEFAKAPFFTLQFGPMGGMPNATVMMPTDKKGIDALLSGLWASDAIVLTLHAGETEDSIVLRVPLYNDPSYRDVFNHLYDRITGKAG